MNNNTFSITPFKDFKCKEINVLCNYFFLILNDKYQIKAVAYAEEEGGECWKGIKKSFKCICNVLFLYLNCFEENMKNKTK